MDTLDKIVVTIMFILAFGAAVINLTIGIENDNRIKALEAETPKEFVTTFKSDIQSEHEGVFEPLGWGIEVKCYRINPFTGEREYIKCTPNSNVPEERAFDKSPSSHLPLKFYKSPMIPPAGSEGK